MKIVFAILFGLDTLAIVSLGYLLLKLYDHGTKEATLIAMLLAIVACIVLFVYLMRRYLKVPSSKISDECIY